MDIRGVLVILEFCYTHGCKHRGYTAKILWGRRPLTLTKGLSHTPPGGGGVVRDLSGIREILVIFVNFLVLFGTLPAPLWHGPLIQKL